VNKAQGGAAILPSPPRAEGDSARGTEIRIANVALVADPAGVLYWPEHGLLAVADLHLEKGSSYARRGIFLPPYDTAATLARLGALIARYAPRTVVALGDSFHDGGGPDRVRDDDRAALAGLQRGRDWIWIAGNHDPDPPAGVGGRCADMLAVGAIVFRHEPSPRTTGEIAGHLHPVARVSQRGRAVSRRCFAANAERVVMPAFGAFTGGLNIRDRAFKALLGRAFTAHMLGDDRLYAFGAARCLPD
jgi:DNA ligase-associated metallophosphoesterase